MAREMKEHELVSPVDLPGQPIEGRHPLGWTFVTIAVAAVALFFANAGTLSAWVDEKPVSEPQQRVSEQAAAWSATMDASGVTAPRRTLHEQWKTMQTERFGDEAPGETQ